MAVSLPLVGYPGRHSAPFSHLRVTAEKAKIAEGLDKDLDCAISHVCFVPLEIFCKDLQ